MNFAVKIAIIITSFSLTPAAFSKTVSLHTNSVSSAPLSQLEMAFENPEAANFESVDIGVSTLSADDSLLSIQQRYRSEFFDFLGMDIMSYIEQNPSIYKSINDYVDDPPDGSDPLWETTNAKLRTGKALTAREAKFKVELEKAMSVLPQYQCLCFRGGSLSLKRLESYKEGQVITEKTFLSTSIDPNIAANFANTVDSEKVPTIYLIKVKSGTPVSTFHAFHWAEYEVLVPAGRSFKVHKVLKNQDLTRAYILMEQI